MKIEWLIVAVLAWALFGVLVVIYCVVLSRAAREWRWELVEADWLARLSWTVGILLYGLIWPRAVYVRWIKAAK